MVSGQQTIINRFKYQITAFVVGIRKSTSGWRFVKTQMGKFAFTGQHPLTYFPQAIAITENTI
jgi:hypothetical protein